ncbi:hypothetical protein N7478_006355 [Penicillium angulare]|uniref:uncharacterized protein n=1 Tax=Penicillium angulare TaxID=116970 RepID=UPI00254128E6|nr:uncharacterized protein N7478_006355 [Penicillium angulare]KAJ5280983.1 hypothetical protein N7478_006355 [Penicillium angulare]
MLSSTFIPVNPTGGAEPMANAFQDYALHSHVDDETLFQLLSAYSHDDCSIFEQLEDSRWAQPPSFEPSLTVDPSLLELPSKPDELSALLPPAPVDLAVLDDILESPVSSSSNGNDSTQSSNMVSDMVVEPVAHTFVDTVPNAVSDMVSHIASNIVVDMSPNTVPDMVSNTSFETVFNPFSETMPDTVGNIIPSTMVDNLDTVRQIILEKQRRCPLPSYNQQPFSQPYYSQPYLPPQPAYNQLMYPPSAAPPFTQPVYATAPIHPMGYNPYPYMMPLYPVQMAPPMHRPQPRPQPTKPPKVFEFVNPTVPDKFVANPNNHARWEVDKDGSRHYLNAPAARR